jgi:hypothetical protein
LDNKLCSRFDTNKHKFQRICNFADLKNEIKSISMITKRCIEVRRGLAFLRDLNQQSSKFYQQQNSSQPAQFQNSSTPLSSFGEEAEATEEQSNPAISQNLVKKFSKPVSPLPLQGLAAFPEESLQNYNFSPDQITSQEFPEHVKQVLSTPVNELDVEIKPDGPLYLPEVRYRRILLTAFGPGGWCLVPRGPHSIVDGILSREYALYASGRLISIARGAALIQGHSNAAASSESVRSNALMRCCKDLGVASELWDPSYVTKWKDRYAAKKSFTDRYGNTKYVFTNKNLADNA